MANLPMNARDIILCEFSISTHTIRYSDLKFFALLPKCMPKVIVG